MRVEETWEREIWELWNYIEFFNFPFSKFPFHYSASRIPILEFPIQVSISVLKFSFSKLPFLIFRLQSSPTHIWKFFHN